MHASDRENQQFVSLPLANLILHSSPRGCLCNQALCRKGCQRHSWAETFAKGTQLLHFPWGYHKLTLSFRAPRVCSMAQLVVTSLTDGVITQKTNLVAGDGTMIGTVLANAIHADGVQERCR